MSTTSVYEIFDKNTFTSKVNCQYVDMFPTQSEEASTKLRSPEIFFGLGGASITFNQWTDMWLGNSEKVSVCLVGGTFQAATKKLQSIQDVGISSSSEASSAAISAELASVYAIDRPGTERLAARKIMYLLESKLRSNSLISANKLLESADVTKLGSRSMIGMIRSTYRIKSDLPAWESTYKKSWVQVRVIGKSPEALFIGLPPVEEVEIASASK